MSSLTLSAPLSSLPPLPSIFLRRSYSTPTLCADHLRRHQVCSRAKQYVASSHLSDLKSQKKPPTAVLGLSYALPTLCADRLLPRHLCSRKKQFVASSDRSDLKPPKKPQTDNIPMSFKVGIAIGIVSGMAVGCLLTGSLKHFKSSLTIIIMAEAFALLKTVLEMFKAAFDLPESVKKWKKMDEESFGEKLLSEIKKATAKDLPESERTSRKLKLTITLELSSRDEEVITLVQEETTDLVFKNSKLVDNDGVEEDVDN